MTNIISVRQNVKRISLNYPKLEARETINPYDLQGKIILTTSKESMTREYHPKRSQSSMNSDSTYTCKLNTFKYICLRFSVA